jgi:hypothetical protein
MNILLRAARAIREIDRVAAPASTLLWVTIALALLATMARAEPLEARWQAEVVVASQPTPSPVTAWVPEVAAAGEPLRFAVEWAPRRAAPVEAYLPGLVYDPVALELDSRSGLLRGVLRVPEAAPRRGWFTLRLVGETGAEWDLRIPLVAPAEPTGTI